MKSFLFINLAIDCGYVGVNHGLAWLAPVLRAHGYDVSCIHLTQELSSDELVDRVSRLNPDIIGFSATTHQLSYLRLYAQAIRSSKAIIIAGGVGVTLDPDWVMTQTVVDGVCVGEGEGPLAALLQRVAAREDLTQTPGFWWRKTDAGVQKNPPPPFEHNLDALSPPDYSFYDRNAVVSGDGHLFVMLSRGCPYNCYYCCNKALQGVYETGHGYFRVPTVEYALQVLESLVRQYPEAKAIEFEDDLLIANREWFLDFAEQYRKRIGLPYRVCVRVECVKPDIVKALKESGCCRVLLGLESGNEAFRKKYLNRNYSNKLLVEKCRMFRKADIDLFTFNIVGFPLEGESEMRDTLLLNKQAKPNGGVCTFFYPYKHTQLHRICEENGLLLDEKESATISNYNTRPSIRMSDDLAEVCVTYQKEISDYLERRRLLWRIEHRPGVMPKALKRFTSPAWYASFMRPEGYLFRSIRVVYRISGLRSLLGRRD